MRAGLSVLTIVMLLAHAVLGCCSHHVHACGEAHEPVGFHADGTQDLAICHSHTAPDSGQSGTEHQQRDDCQGSKCDFGRPVNEQVIKFYPVLDQWVVLPTSSLQIPAVGGHREQDLCPSDVLLQPIRLHLLNQVLLI